VTPLAEYAWVAPLAAAVAALLLAGWILVRPWAVGFLRVLAWVLLLTAAVQGANVLFLLGGDPVLWRNVALSAELLRMAVLFQLGASLIGRSAAESDPRANTWARVAWGLALAGVGAAWWGAFAGVNDEGAVVLGPAGRPVLAVLLLALAFAVAQIELVLRSSADPFRFRIKFALLGVGALAGFEVYVCAQSLLLGEWRPYHAVVGGAVGVVCVGVVAFGLGRVRLARTVGRVAVSPQTIYGSLTLLGVGLYLLGVGLLSELLRVSGRPFSVGAAEVVVFLLTLGLVAGIFSRSARARFRVFVSRHFLRSRYDYRTKWLEVTDAFRSAESTEEILDRLLELLAGTFGTGRLSVWMRYEADDRFHQVRSTNIEPPPAPLSRAHPVVAALAATDAPIELGRLDSPEDGDPFLEKTSAVLGVPVLGAGALLAFVVLGPGPSGAGYDADDRDLLRAIAHHAGVLLAHARLADDRQAAAEIDALNRFAAFYLHDLKNLTARLSLVAQNAAKHGEDPEFRASAMKTVERTAQQMSELMARLSRRAPALGRVQSVDLRELVETTVRSLGPEFGAEVAASAGEGPHVLAVPEQVQQVVLNLVLNAKKATGELAGDGTRAPALRIAVGAGSDSEHARLEVVDEGPGIPPERLRTLFEPFRSGTSGGFGIGLYESKRIVESYGGTLRVDSAPGRGTRVTVELPAVAPEATVGQTSQTVKELGS
jgi:putative PEP-CTERM system histidine kinase